MVRIVQKSQFCHKEGYSPRDSSENNTYQKRQSKFIEHIELWSLFPLNHPVRSHYPIDRQNFEEHVLQHANFSPRKCQCQCQKDITRVSFKTKFSQQQLCSIWHSLRTVRLRGRVVETFCQRPTTPFEIRCVRLSNQKPLLSFKLRVAESKEWHFR